MDEVDSTWKNLVVLHSCQQQECNLTTKELVMARYAWGIMLPTLYRVDCTGGR